MNILVVDDIALNRRLLRAQLEAEGHTVLEASDGNEALARAEREAVDAIISDVLMPNLDGFGLCYAVRAHERLHALPFIIYTSTYTSPSDRELAESIGADCYLLKPVSPSLMLEALAEAQAKSLNCASTAAQLPNETSVFKQYNAALVKKLEQKNAGLQVALQELDRAHQLLAEQNRALERRVQERTAELERANAELVESIANVKTLSGLMPICSYCKKVRDDKAYWHSVESYITQRTDAVFSHSICPDCLKMAEADLGDFQRAGGTSARAEEPHES